MVTSRNFSTLLQALRLSQGMSKPFPTFGAGLEQIAPTSANNTQEDTQPFDSGYPRQATDHFLHPILLDQTSTACSVQPYFSQDDGIPSFAPFDPAKATVFRYRQQQSVNLGSWYASSQHQRFMLRLT